MISNDTTTSLSDAVCLLVFPGCASSKVGCSTWLLLYVPIESICLVPLLRFGVSSASTTPVIISMSDSSVGVWGLPSVLLCSFALAASCIILSSFSGRRKVMYRDGLLIMVPLCSASSLMRSSAEWNSALGFFDIAIAISKVCIRFSGIDPCLLYLFIIVLAKSASCCLIVSISSLFIVGGVISCSLALTCAVLFPVCMISIMGASNLWFSSLETGTTCVTACCGLTPLILGFVLFGSSCPNISSLLSPMVIVAVGLTRAISNSKVDGSCGCALVSPSGSPKGMYPCAV